MPRPDDVTTFLCTLGFLLLHLGFVAMWIFAIWRTRLWFFYIALFVSLLASLLSITNLILYYDPPFVPRVLGREVYAIFFYSFIWVQFAVAVLGFVGTLFQLRWIFASYDKQKEAPKV
jgi:hypothetical protein